METCLRHGRQVAASSLPISRSDSPYHPHSESSHKLSLPAETLQTPTSSRGRGGGGGRDQGGGWSQGVLGAGPLTGSRIPRCSAPRKRGGALGLRWFCAGLPISRSRSRVLAPTFSACGRCVPFTHDWLLVQALYLGFTRVCVWFFWGKKSHGEVHLALGTNDLGKGNVWFVP